MALPWIIFSTTAMFGCGLIAGAFFAFSSFVMNALGRLAPAHGMAAMQSINVTVINVSFMTLLFGTAAVCAGSAVTAALQWARPGAGWAVAGAVCYLVGTIGLTIVFHVPRNDALALIDPSAPEATAAWAKYVHDWTIGNHVRTLAAVVAMVLFGLSIRATYQH